MVPPRYEPDPSLTRRMLAAMVLVILTYAAAVLPAFVYGGLSWGLPAVAAAALLAVVQARYLDRLALWATDGREVNAAEEPELHAIVDRLCMSADLPKPRLAVAATEVPNAFAAGSGPGAAVVCVTAGLRERLEPAELAAVLAHEMAHIRNRDVLVASIAAFPSMCAELVLTLLGWLLTGAERRGPAAAAATLLGVLLLPLGLAAAVLWLIGLVTSSALSRHRELCADATGTLLTGRPTDLATALAKVSDGVRGAGRADRRALRPVSTLCMVPAASGRRDTAELLSTHPSLERRTVRLGLISRRLADGG